MRADTDQVSAVQSVLAATANPEAPNEVNVSRPSAALEARARAKGALNTLSLGLGAVSLLVGAVGVANIMLIGVLQRRSEIGLRRALGATTGHILIQFLSEAILLAGLGGTVGVAAGAFSTALYAPSRIGRSWCQPLPGREDSAPPFSSVPSLGSCPRCVQLACRQRRPCGPCDGRRERHVTGARPERRFACVGLRRERRQLASEVGVVGPAEQDFRCPPVDFGARCSSY